MTVRTAITEGSLRRALRDDRYWRPWHPERSALAAWVTDGFRALADDGPEFGGTVFVESVHANGERQARAGRGA